MIPRAVAGCRWVEPFAAEVVVRAAVGEDCFRCEADFVQGTARDWGRTVRFALPTVSDCRYRTLGDGRDERSRLAVLCPPPRGVREEAASGMAKTDSMRSCLLCDSPIRACRVWVRVPECYSEVISGTSPPTLRSLQRALRLQQFLHPGQRLNL